MWKSENGGTGPPFFPDLKDCRECVAGASYARYSGGYNPTGRGPQLACFNKRCYTEKLEDGAAAYREKLEKRKKYVHREDRETAQRFVAGLAVMHNDTLRALATTLMARTDKLELQHPFGPHRGEFVQGWSYEAGATSRAREILGLAMGIGNFGVRYLEGDGIKALGNVDPADLRELVANLMTHHLRIEGQLETASVSQETAS